MTLFNTRQHINIIALNNQSGSIAWLFNHNFLKNLKLPISLRFAPPLVSVRI